ncbi:MAG: prealbumin-like fold domain-containing protein [Clostridia bacterium]
MKEIWNEPAVWRIWKQDQQTGKELQGAKIGLYDSHGVQLLTVETNEEGYVDFSYLTPGRYYFCEIVAPPDYQLNDATYQFEVLEDGTIQGDSIVLNDRMANPKTGDSNTLVRIVLLGLGMMASIGGIIALKIRSRRRWKS